MFLGKIYQNTDVKSDQDMGDLENNGPEHIAKKCSENWDSFNLSLFRCFQTKYKNILQTMGCNQ